MAATVINYTLVQSTLPGPPAQYSVQATITSTTNVDQSLFVYRYSDQEFDHVATTLDVLTYPTSLNPSYPFYRQTTVTRLNASPAAAVDFAQTVKSRLTSLAREYDLVATTFVPGTYPISVP